MAAELFGPPGQRGFAIRYWDGIEESSPQNGSFTLVLRHPGALRGEPPGALCAHAPAPCTTRRHALPDESSDVEDEIAQGATPMEARDGIRDKRRYRDPLDRQIHGRGIADGVGDQQVRDRQGRQPLHR